MRATKLLRRCTELPIETVVDVGVGRGFHAMAFLSKGRKVTGIDYRKPIISHDEYTHIQGGYEGVDLECDLVWCCHTLEHVPDPGFMLRKFKNWGAEYLAIAVPDYPSSEIHVGHLTMWTPFHLMYNLVVNGWDCKDARWYTEAGEVCVLVEKCRDVDPSGRTAMLSEVDWLNTYMPVPVEHRGSAWWPDLW